jgi:hypothetical protein
MHLPKWTWLVLVVVATAITLLEGYPWLDIQKDEILSPSNPYRNLLIIVNQGYIPISSVEVVCIVNVWAGRRSGANNVGFLNTVLGTYWHEGKFTVPCAHVGINKAPVILAKMTITVSYAVFGLKFRFLRGQQTFHVEALRADDGSYRWTFR